ncbi:MAG: antibiotic ABC transporter ATP-binding protein, partial [candidate division Zixibacteria bacterium CG_4_9_14_3_um_filter_46_8]
MAQNYHEEEILGKAYDSRLMKRLLKYLLPYKTYVVLSLMMLIAISALQLAGPYLSKIAIDKYIMAKDYSGLKNIAAIYMAFLVLQ